MCLHYLPGPLGRHTCSQSYPHCQVLQLIPGSALMVLELCRHSPDGLWVTNLTPDCRTTSSAGNMHAMKLPGILAWSASEERHCIALHHMSLTHSEIL